MYSKDPLEVLLAREDEQQEPLPFTFLNALSKRGEESIKRFERLSTSKRFCLMVIQKFLTEVGCDFVTVEDLELIVNSETHEFEGVRVIGKEAAKVFQGIGYYTSYTDESGSVFKALACFVEVVEVIIMKKRSSRATFSMVPINEDHHALDHPTMQLYKLITPMEDELFSETSDHYQAAIEQVRFGHVGAPVMELQEDMLERDRFLTNSNEFVHPKGFSELN